jgi:hypothetical protein
MHASGSEIPPLSTAIPAPPASSSMAAASPAAPPTAAFVATVHKPDGHGVEKLH